MTVIADKVWNWFRVTFCTGPPSMFCPSSHSGRASTPLWSLRRWRMWKMWWGRIWPMECVTTDSLWKVGVDGLASSSGILWQRFACTQIWLLCLFVMWYFFSRLPVSPHPVHPARPPWNHVDRAEEVWIWWWPGVKSGLPLPSVSLSLKYLNTTPSCERVALPVFVLIKLSVLISPWNWVLEFKL